MEGKNPLGFAAKAGATSSQICPWDYSREDLSRHREEKWAHTMRKERRGNKVDVSQRWTLTCNSANDLWGQARKAALMECWRRDREGVT